MDIFIRTLGLVASISVLVFIHELGHFLFAKLFGIRVDKFYLFFDYKFSLIKFKKWGTEFGIGWIPFGGYCKIAGMIDESMDKEQMKQEPQEWEFRSKPAWQRFFVIVGGVLFNMILAMVVYSMIAWTQGETTLPVKNMKYGMVYNEIFHEIGFQDGDKIVSLDGVAVSTSGKLLNDVLINTPKQITIERNGTQKTIEIPSDISQTILKRKAKNLFTTYIPSIVGEVTEGSEAEKAGLQSGDKFITVEGQDAGELTKLITILKANPEKQVELKIIRAKDTLVKFAQVTKAGTIGFAFRHPAKIFEYETVEYGFLASIPAGYNKAVDKLTSYISQFKLVFTKEGAKQVGGFGTIAKLFPTTWNWLLFWEMTAFLSVMLAFMNILPIPALDGGYIIFILYEMITGKAPSDKFMEKVVPVGFFLLIGLLLYANINDILRFLNIL